MAPPNDPPRYRSAEREVTESIDLDAHEGASAIATPIPSSRRAPGPALRPESEGDLARGTGLPPQDLTKVSSPAARSRPPLPAETSKPRPQPRQTENPDDHVGQVLGTYRLAELIGRGGMGFVYRAEHTRLGREVALKLLRSDYSRRRDAVARFFQEARTVNRIRHRNIVDVTDFVELDDGQTFIIMELLRGTSLTRWAPQGFELARGLGVVIQICEGLAAAHSVGVIHRDLKPDNVVVVPMPDGSELVKLLDFGVAKLVNRDDEDLGLETAAGAVIGTPAFMSPEQAGGMPVDARADIYSVGAIMYEMFCGQPMFRGKSFGEYVRKHLSEHPPRPSSTRGGSGMDPRLEAAILRAIEKDPNRRFSSITELRETLVSLLGSLAPVAQLRTAFGVTDSQRSQRPSLSPSGPGVSSSAHPAIMPVPAGQASARMTPLPTVSTVPWWVWFAGGAVALGIGIGGALWVASRDSTTLPTAIPLAPVESPVNPAAATATVAPLSNIIEIRFESSPTAGVFSASTGTNLCFTPCSVTVDLRDGGSSQERTFVLKAPGHVDESIRVPLSGNRVTAPAITLRRLSEGPPPAPESRSDAIPAPPPAPPPATGTARSTTRSSSSLRRGNSLPMKTLTGDDTSASPRDTTAVSPVVKPPEKKSPPPDKKKIDRTDTIDPFRSNSP
jgi:serine/threonine protein kinase